MKIFVINGANINMLGIREPEIYGRDTYADLVQKVTAHCKKAGAECQCFQSNHEGDLVDKIQQAYFENAAGIVLNPGAYTHTSIALYDALKAVGIPAVEVHISELENREDFRQISYIRSACIATVTGKGLEGYCEAVDILLKNGEERV